jgi:hypothetical protein
MFPTPIAPPIKLTYSILSFKQLDMLNNFDKFVSAPVHIKITFFLFDVIF